MPQKQGSLNLPPWDRVDLIYMSPPQLTNCILWSVLKVQATNNFRLQQTYIFFPDDVSTESHFIYIYKKKNIIRVTCNIIH